MNVFFDVQGTLVSGGRPRPYAREVFLELTRMGHHVYLWSSAGGSYATRAAKLLGIEDIVLGCYSKHAILPVTVDYIVDDHPDFADHHGGYAIPPFDGRPDDEELWGVVDALK